MEAENKPLFRDLNCEDQQQEASEIESLCMNCFKNGITRILLTKIPFYKEVVIMSFSCEACGYKNNEIQPSGEIQQKGSRLTLKVVNEKDLNRRLVKSDFSSFKIVELDFEIPSRSQKGEVTTIEGVIERSITGLEQDQVARRIEHPDEAAELDVFIDSLKELRNVNKPFTIVLEDISGNCHIENPNAPHTDHNCSLTHFSRSEEEDRMLGIFKQSDIDKATYESTDKNSQQSILHPIAEGEWTLEELHGEVLQFQTLCYECGSPCETNMKLTSIPHFKDVVIMATVCDACGCKTNEVKSGGGIEEYGIKIIVKMNGKDDFSRDVLKSETCNIHIPELDCEMGCAALEGRFTTVEGLLQAIKDQLYQHGNIFRDSSDNDTRDRMDRFIDSLDDVMNGKRNITLILDDPAGNSYVQSLSDEGTDDNLTISKYTRTYEQDEELGINDMKLENYEEK